MSAFYDGTAMSLNPRMSMSMGMGMNMGMDGRGSSEFLNMYLDEDYSKSLHPAESPSSGGSGSPTPYDFLGGFAALANGPPPPTVDSPVHTISPRDSYDSPQLAIDPALVGSPSAGPHPRGHHDEGEEDDDEDDVEEIEPVAPIKVGGKGKARKGTVASGGINKKSSAAFAVEKENLGGSSTSKEFASKIEDRESDDWRPSPEEYKKMSSKEKRQLRNKISARNFRVRRKGQCFPSILSQ